MEELTALAEEIGFYRRTSHAKVFLSFNKILGNTILYLDYTQKIMQVDSFLHSPPTAVRSAVPTASESNRRVLSFRF